MISLPAPAALCGEQLAAEVAAATGRVVRVTLAGDVVEVDADSPLNDAQVAPIVAAHVADPAWTATQEEATERTLRDRLRAAQTTNRDYLGLSSPTAAQTTVQVKALTRQMLAHNRLLLRDLGSAE